MWPFRRKTKTIEIARPAEGISLRLVLGTPIYPPIRMALSKDEVKRLLIDRDDAGTRVRLEIEPENEFVYELFTDAVLLEIWWQGEKFISTRINTHQESRSAGEPKSRLTIFSTAEDDQ